MQHDCHSSSFYLKSFDDNQHFLIFALNISVLGYEMSPCKLELKVEESGLRILIGGLVKEFIKFQLLFLFKLILAHII